jgi:hypothetical protein
MSAPPSIALSGGGIIAMLSSMCQLAAIDSIVPNSTARAAITATSGGIVGSVLTASAVGRLAFPPSWSPADYGADAHAVLAQRFTQPGVADSVWFGNIIDVLLASPELIDPRAGARAWRRGAPSANWWTDVLALLARLYKLDGAELRVPPDFRAAVSLLRAAAAPIDRDASGVLRNVTGNLLPAEWTPASGHLAAVGATAGRGPPAMEGVDVLSGLSYATSFWAAALLEDALAYRTLGGLLPRTPGGGFLLVDGGTADTTGIAAALRRGARRIVAFYNDVYALSDASSQLGFMFGVPNHTTALSMWEGPALGQLFPRELYAPVYANLSDPRRTVAHLTDVPVLPNPYLGVAGGYTLDSLLLVGTQYNADFLDAFDAVDPEVRARLSKGWPETMSLLGMSALDANALCVFGGWSVARSADLIRRAFEP